MRGSWSILDATIAGRHFLKLRFGAEESGVENVKYDLYIPISNAHALSLPEVTGGFRMSSLPLEVRQHLIRQIEKLHATSLQIERFFRELETLTDTLVVDESHGFTESEMLLAEKLLESAVRLPLPLDPRHFLGQF